MKHNIFIRRPILAIVTAITMVLLGVLALRSLPIEQYPDIAPPTVSMWASYPGADAETVQKAVVIPLEEAINGVENMSHITSSASNSGDAELMIYFKQGTNADMAAVNVQNRVSSAQHYLPVEVVQSGVMIEKQQNAELKTFALYDTTMRYDRQFLDNYMTINVEPRLKRIAGVGKTMLFGSSYSMRIWLQPDKMAQYKLNPDDIAAVFAGQNIEASTGTFGENSASTYQYSMKYRGRFSTETEFGNMVLRSLPNGEVLRLKDVARIELGDETYSYDTRVNGKPGSMMTLYQTAGSNAAAVNNEVDAALKELSASLPKGLSFVTLSDTNRFLYASIHEVVKTLLIALLLVVLVVFFFLQNFRATLIPTISIFVSIIATFAFLSVVGFSINLLTLFALVVAIGTVVDDAIIVVEAVQARYESDCRSPYQAVDEAISNVSRALIVSTLIFMAVFVPVSMMGGTAGTFYAQFGLTMAAAVGLSAINALTLSPALCALMLKPHKDDEGTFAARYRNAFNTAFTTLLDRYKQGILFFVRRKWLTGGLVLCGLVLLSVLIRTTKTGFIPDEDAGSIMVSMTTKPGSTMAVTEREMEKMSQYLASIPEVEHSAAVTGWSMESSGSVAGMFFLTLRDWKERKDKDQSADAIVEKISAKAVDFPDAQVYVMTQPMVSGFGMSGGFDLYLQDKMGGDVEAFKQVVDRFTAALNERQEIATAYSAYKINYPQYWVDIDAAQCERTGISPSEILSVLSSYYSGDYVSNFNRFSKQYRVMMQAEPSARATPQSLQHFYIRVGNEMAPLSQFVKLTKTYGPQSLSRFNLFNSIDVSGTPAAGYSSGDALKAVKETAEKYLPQNYSYEFGSVSREEATFKHTVALALIICIVFIYLILSGLYESLLLPFVVLLTVPCALMGSFLLVKLCGLENNIYLQTGLILLIGLQAKTAILITDYAGEQRRSGMSLKQAAIGAAKHRLRPILMTVSAMLFGMLPLMFASGVGANGTATLGTGVVGGLVVGTLALLFLTPSLWIIFQRWQERVRPIVFEEPDLALAEEKRLVVQLKQQKEEEQK